MTNYKELRQNYRDCLRIVRNLPSDLENIIIEYVMDLHHFDSYKKMKEHYENYLLIYSERMEENEHGLNLNVYPMMYEKFRVINIARFMREIIFNVTLRKYKFFDRDLKFLANYLLPNTKMMVVGYDFIMFDMNDSVKMYFRFQQHEHSPYLNFVYDNMEGV